MKNKRNTRSTKTKTVQEIIEQVEVQLPWKLILQSDIIKIHDKADT